MRQAFALLSGKWRLEIMWSSISGCTASGNMLPDARSIFDEAIR